MMLNRSRFVWKWVRQHPWLTLLSLFCAGYLGLNVLAFQHAKAMLYFAREGSRTASPERLSAFGKLEVLVSGVRVPRPENDRTPLDVGLEFQTARISVDAKVVLEAWMLPTDGPLGAVILHHGYAGSKSDLLPEAVAFHELGYVVWLVDFRGSGGSSENYTTIGFAEAEDVAAMLAHVRKVSPTLPVVMYGRSMGAAAILRAIHVHDSKPDAVILESVFDRLRTTVGNRFRLMGLPAYPAANLLIFWGGVSAGFNGGGHNPIDYAPSCRCPTTLLHGEVDPNAGVLEAGMVQLRIGDQASKLVVFKNTGHVPIRKADVTRWNEAVLRLLARLHAPRELTPESGSQ